MVNFDLDLMIENLSSMWKEYSMGPETDKEADLLITNYRLWCLGHNFDVVGAILSMASLSWTKGFEAGRLIANFAPE